MRTRLVTDMLARSFRFFGSQPAVMSEGMALTYSELQLRSNRLANALAGLGVGRGDRVAVLSENRPEVVVACLACAKSGAVTVPLNYRLSPGEVVAIVGDAEPRMLVYDHRVREAAGAVRERGLVEHVVELNGSAYERLIETGRMTEPVPADVDEDSPLALMYTAGTTGEPKGALISHRNMISAMLMRLGTPGRPSPAWASPSGGSLALPGTPWCHSVGMNSMFGALFTGRTLLLERRFEPEAFGHLLRHHRVRAVTVTPSMLQFALKTPGLRGHDYSFLEVILCAGSPISPALLAEAIDVFGQVLTQAYGMTEACGAITFLLPHEHVVQGPESLVRRLGSCGRAGIMNDVRVVTEGDVDVRPGEPGEIIARGPNVMRGYWKLPEATAEALRGGWLRTGDIATVDEEGYVFILDRRNEKIVTGGENVYPCEVESVLMTHSSVAEAAVIGVPSERWGEEIKAFVVLRPHRTTTLEEFQEFCRPRLARFKMPRSVEILKSLPRNAMGKLDRRLLREPYWRDRTRRVS